MKNNKGFSVTELLALMALLAMFTVVFGAVYVVAHYVAKFW